MTVRVEHGDSREVLKTLADDSIDSCVTDPPYALVSIVKRFANSPRNEKTENTENPYGRTGRGFMGKQWDTGETAFDPAFWAEVYRVLKPGAHLVAFSGTRTYHRMTCAIEDAGFEIRDQIGWLYGAGFPKSHNTNKALHGRICCCDDEAKSPTECDLRPLRDADVSAQVDTPDQRREVLQQGVSQPGSPAAMLRSEPEESGARGGECRLEGRGDVSQAPRELRVGEVCPMPAGSSIDGEARRLCDGAQTGDGPLGRATASAGRVRPPRGSQAAEQRAQQPGTVAGQPEPQDGGAWPLCDRCGKPVIPDGLGTALKPAWEPICLARKPLIGTVASNVLEHGTGALNIDGCRVGSAESWVASGAQTGGDSVHDFGDGLNNSGRSSGHSSGRWPANVILDGSEEVLAAFPDAPGQQRGVGPQHGEKASVNVYGDYGARDQFDPRGDSGSAARFFYSAKADGEDRLGSKHPTVKPIDLIAYLCRLVTPPGGTVLDPFAGSGTCGAACLRECFDCILIEREAEYIPDIMARIELASADGRHPQVIKHRNVDPAKARGEDLPMFAGTAA